MVHRDDHHAVAGHVSADVRVGVAAAGQAVRKHRHRPPLAVRRRVEHRGISVRRQLDPEQLLRHPRNQTRQLISRAQEFRKRVDRLALRLRDPSYGPAVLALPRALTRVENAKSDGVYSALGQLADGRQIGDRNFDVDGADFVGAVVARKTVDWAEAAHGGQVRSHCTFSLEWRCNGPKISPKAEKRSAAVSRAHGGALGRPGIVE